MALATTLSRAQNGLAAELVTVEVHLAPGLPGVHIVGLPDKACSEARDRVKAAIANSGFEFPSSRKLIINLAPADLPKDGGRFDLAIALAILVATHQLPAEALAATEILGELSLSGELRPVQGALPAALRATACGHRLLLPACNAAEAALVRQARVAAAESLAQLIAALQAGTLDCVPQTIPPAAADAGPDLSEVRGQHAARRALEIAAAGGHSMLMVGPPGSGKSMLAQRLPSILPPLGDDEALEAAAVASIGPGGFDPRRWGLRPFRSPHHTASGPALVGGGSVPRPGEATLAHLGVLFLDELPEFPRRVLDVLREPLETGCITVSRAARHSDFPARFQLVAAMNPCPCGYLGDSSGRCRCTPAQVAQYRAHVSGPLLDRIDLQVFVPRVEQRLLHGAAPPAESSAEVRGRVSASRVVQRARQGKPNAQLAPRELDRHCVLDPAARSLLDCALQRLSLSARSCHRVIKVARTIADLQGSTAIQAEHVAEAVGYREYERAAAAAA